MYNPTFVHGKGLHKLIITQTLIVANEVRSPDVEIMTDFIVLVHVDRDVAYIQ